MPWRLFEELWKAHAKRKAAENLERVRAAIISGIWANPNLDAEGNPRTKALNEIEQRFKQALIEIYEGPDVTEIDQGDPFFSAMKVPEIEHKTVSAKSEHDQADS